MKKDIIKAMMHPIRVKIIQELTLKQTATTKELISSCGDCAQATIYRHLKVLLEHEIIEVVSSHQINGITEKVYGISGNLNEKILGDPNKLTQEDYYNLFSQYIISLLTGFSSYFEEETDMKQVPQNIGFSTSAIYLSDEELREMSKELAEVFMKRLEFEPTKNRKMRNISTVVTTALNKKNI